MKPHPAHGSTSHCARLHLILSGVEGCTVKPCLLPSGQGFRPTREDGCRIKSGMTYTERAKCKRVFHYSIQSIHQPHPERSRRMNNPTKRAGLGGVPCVTHISHSSLWATTETLGWCWATPPDTGTPVYLASRLHSACPLCHSDNFIPVKAVRRVALQHQGLSRGMKIENCIHLSKIP